MSGGKRVITTFTEGSIPKQLIMFSLPMILTNLLQNLYSMVDTIVVGQVVGSAGISGVSIGSSIALLMTNMCIGFASGGQVMISQIIGSKERDKKSLSQAIGTIISTVSIFALVMMVISLLFHNTFLGWMNTPEEALSQGRDYMFICSFGFIFVCGYNSVCAVLRGSGDSRRPMYIIGIAAVINLGLDILFVVGFDMGAAGAALATVIAQAVSFIIAASYLYKNRKEFGFEFNLQSFKINADKFKVLLKLGIPMAIQTAAIYISLMFVNALINSYGLAASASYSVGRKIQLFSAIISQGVGMAAGAMIGQNFGAGHKDRITKIFWWTEAISMTAALICVVLALTIPVQIFSVFTSDAEVLEFARPFMRILIISFFGGAAMSGYQAVLQGIGFATFSMATSLLDGVVLRLSLSLLFGVALNMGVTGLFLGNNMSLPLCIIPAAIYFHSGKWKNRQVVVR